MSLMESILRVGSEIGASDIHITVGRPAIFRINGLLQSLDPGVALKGRDTDFLQKKLLPADTLELGKSMMDEAQFQKYLEWGEVDFSYSIAGVGRFRVNVFKQRGSLAMAMRIIRTQIPSLGELDLPEVIGSLARRPRGLVLVTGPSGSGKSTTLAAMVDLINSETKSHIITLEDPIEYLHFHKQSIVNQREIGLDALSFAKALRAAMREDPDVILVGEMRDLETIGTAITAAETGHLVLATLHTTGAAQTIDRIIDVFPPHQQQQIRIQLANTLQGVVCQQLLPRRDDTGRVVALEIMVVTPAIRNLIREGKTHQILSQIQIGGKYGMQTLDMSLRSLVQRGIVSLEAAGEKAGDIEIINKHNL
ncbi:type IV pilus twitching motility protein PilT [Desulforamulus ruminis]|uniref:type IV pilus twitching motility protein PilT n=1 Tax=Desulforamulus ruminis TaxID=1564 RepID=UPI002FDB20EA